MSITDVLTWAFYIFIGLIVFSLCIYFIFSPLALIVGLIKPGAVVPKDQPQTRGRVILIFGIPTIILSFLVGVGTFSGVPAQESVPYSSTVSVSENVTVKEQPLEQQKPLESSSGIAFRNLPSDKTANKELVGVGEEERQGSYGLIVNEVETNSPGLYNEDLGSSTNRIVYLDITINSYSDHGVSVNPLFARLKSSDGFSYNPKLFSMEKQILASENDISQGDKVRGWLAFEVPSYEEGYIFEYMPPFLGKKLKVAL